MSATKFEHEVLCDLPRRECILRITLDTARAISGAERRYVSIREWYRAPDGELRPTRVGVTIRASELREAAEALARGAVSIGVAGPQASSAVRAILDEHGCDCDPAREGRCLACRVREAL